jgi:hypothetical protein
MGGLNLFFFFGNQSLLLEQCHIIGIGGIWAGLGLAGNGRAKPWFPVREASVYVEAILFHRDWRDLGGSGIGGKWVERKQRTSGQTTITTDMHALVLFVAQGNSVLSC